MPNYDGKPPLKMSCPKCGAYGSHPVRKTFPEDYKWHDRTTDLFRTISGSDISFRQRQKQCVQCERSFLSVEMSKHYLKDLIEHVERLNGEWESFRAENGKLRQEAKRLRGIVEQVERAVSEL